MTNKKTTARYFNLKSGITKNNIYGSSIGINTRNINQIIYTLKKGLPITAFEKLQREIGISAKLLAASINIALRTLARRKKEGKLHSDESERLFRVAKLFDKATHLLESRELAQQWFKTSKKVLGGKTPLEFIDTEPGAQEVEDLIGRLEHGVFS